MGLEKIVWSEISHKWELFLNSEIPQVNFELGGIELHCELQDGLAINYFSKTANRVLLRLKQQKCRDIPKLFNIISKLKWKSYLKREDVEWNITCHESRLFNTKKIEKACSDGLAKYFNANQLPQKIKDQKEKLHQQSIYLRFDQDVLTISLDTSGNLLHIRGGEKFRGHASIRSTLASSLLWKLLKDETHFTLIDPMCGTGTFLKEAITFYELSARSFPHQDWACEMIFNKIMKELTIEKLIGFDIDPNVIKKNLQEKSLIHYEQQDIFKLDLSEPPHHPIVICNPPYGKRVKLTRPREVYFQQIIDQVIEKIMPKKFGIILPQDIKLKQKSKVTRIFNSGIWLNFHEIKT